MTKDEALAHLKRLIPALQKDRSNAMESCGTEEIAADLAPWSVGPKALLPKVVEIVDSGVIDKTGFYNIMWIVKHHIQPANVVLIGQGQEPMPEPDPMWMMEDWD